MYTDIAVKKADELIKKNTATVLAIESSCDETAAAVVKNGREILSNVISTQIPVHQRYGGVVPEIASRQHTAAIVPVAEHALNAAGLDFDGVDAIAVTAGPGLIGAVLTGVTYAKALALALEKPLVAVHHIQGHIFANFLQFPELTPPFMALAVSGGHSHIFRVDGYCDFTLLGATRDDAAGEAFDKAARVLGLGYPGGVMIDNRARLGNPKAYTFSTSVAREDNFDFSFSGVKTAVVNLVHKFEQNGEPVPVDDIAASFQASVVKMLAEKTVRAAQENGLDKLVLGGGVAANTALRRTLAEMCEKRGIKLFVPEPELCTDNAAMIGSAGFYSLMSGRLAGMDLNAFASCGLCEFYKPERN